MQKIVDYVVLEGASHQNLTDLVKIYLDFGWQPIGGVAFAKFSDGTTPFCQAV